MAKRTPDTPLDLDRLPRPERDPRVLALHDKLRAVEAEIEQAGRDLAAALAEAEAARQTEIAAITGDASRAQAEAAARALDEAERRAAALRRRIAGLAQAREAVTATLTAEVAAAKMRALAEWDPHRARLVREVVDRKEALREAESALGAFDRERELIAAWQPDRTARVRVLRPSVGGAIGHAAPGEVRGVPAGAVAELVRTGQAEPLEPWRRVLVGLPLEPTEPPAMEA